MYAIVGDVVYGCRRTAGSGLYSIVFALPRKCYRLAGVLFARPKSRLRRVKLGNVHNRASRYRRLYEIVAKNMKKVYKIRKYVLTDGGGGDAIIIL